MNKVTHKILSLTQLYDCLPINEKLITDVLRNIFKDNLPDYCKEKISFNVPYFYGNNGIAIIWPATIPRGGIKSGVMLGFWYGNKLKDVNNYLKHGTNKKIYYKIYNSIDEVDPLPIITLIREAVYIDGCHN